MKYGWLVFVASLLSFVEAQFTHAQESLDDYCMLTKSEIMFRAAQSSYKMWGICHNAKKPWYVQGIPWNSQGEYRTKDGVVTEIFTFETMVGPEGITLRQSCKSDPWLTTAECTRPRIGASSWSNVIGSHANIVLSFAEKGRPITSYFNYPRPPLLTKRDADLKAEADAAAAAKAAEERRRIQQATKPAPSYLANIMPLVRSPSSRQNFHDRTVVPIRLAPPPQWPPPDIDAKTGAIIRTAQSVQLYLVNIQRKNPNGQWVAHTTIPIGAAQAESAAGYTGFGNGAPPGGITTPGSWRLRAQVSSPHQSGWSDWVEFSVMTPPSSTNVMKPGVGFGKK